jgi:aspartate racemase
MMNEETASRLGGLHSSRMILYSVNFAEFERLMSVNDWDGVTGRLVEISGRLKLAGAESIVICTNTMHKAAPIIEKETNLPVLHIADAAGEEITRQGSTTVGLLGTKFTMEEGFYRERLDDFGIDVLIPPEKDRDIVDRIIFGELCRGIKDRRSTAELMRIMDNLVEHGAEGIVLGCTELPLVIGGGDVPYPIFDTMKIHASYAVDWALNEGKPEA